VSASYKGKKQSDDLLDSKELKLAYILKKLHLPTKDVAKELGVSSALISQIKSEYESSNRLRNIHIYAICFAYNVPIEIFKNRDINSSSKIDTLFTEQHKEITIFNRNNEILDKLIGIWYMYSYPSNLRLTDIWQTKTTFYDDYRVVDEHDNRGTLNIGKSQSIILKESAGSKNITSITFDNSRIFYNIFLFSRVSKSNSMNKELFNFGICSRKKLDKKLVKEILGEVNEVQLQINYNLLERLNDCLEMEE